MEYNNKFQFKKESQVQKWPYDADEMHTIMDILGNFSFSDEGTSYDFDLKYNMDLIYTNIQSTPIMVNGSGIYDYIIDIQGNQNQKMRIYFKYTFEDFSVPEDGYPSGKLTLETKRWTIEFVFNGTNMVTITVKDNGNIALTDTINLDEDV